MYPVTFKMRPGIAFEAFPEGCVLFSEDSQQLHELNASAALMVEALVSGATMPDLEAALEASGVGSLAAREWTGTLLRELARTGALAADPPATNPLEEQFIEICGSIIQLRYFSRRLFANLAPDYAHLQTPPRQADTIYDILETDGVTLLSRQGRPAVLVEAPMAGVQLKSMIMEEQIASGRHLAALHAACLVLGGRALLLFGQPGAGKSTLALALLSRGFTFASDDVTFLDENGCVRGLPLPVGVKEAGWNSAGSFVPMPRSSHSRPDGQLVKYIPVHSLFSGPAPVHAIADLHRDGSAEAEIADISSADCLRTIFSESRSGNGRCTVDIMRSLAVAVRRSHNFELRYGEASDAADCIHNLFSQ